jgi:hypothetical protein
MDRVLILVEGQTEESFVRDVLGPHLGTNFEVYIEATLVTTKRPERGGKFGGGVSTFAKVYRDILRLLRDTNVTIVTTMLDFYGIPDDFPGLDTLPTSDCFAYVSNLEGAFGRIIDNPRFLPYLSLHEFEALLFSDPSAIASTFPDKIVSAQLARIRAEFPSPEEINNGPDTHPSQRIHDLIPTYQKRYHGSTISKRIGLNTIRGQCAHFDEWVRQLEQCGSL